MQLGAFSVSLVVRDLDVSRTFYQQLGFQVFAGDASQNWLIMKNESCLIGLFQGMFEKNILTFNPGLTQDAQQLSEFKDVRAIRAALVEAGVEITTDTDPDGTGPASIAFVDPDGNPILIDQFFPRPGS